MIDYRLIELLHEIDKDIFINTNHPGTSVGIIESGYEIELNTLNVMRQRVYMMMNNEEVEAYWMEV